MREIRVLEEAISIDKSNSALSSENNLAILENASSSFPGWTYNADAILSSELTPLDRFYTVSALLGRLREPLDTPLPPNSTHLAKKSVSTKKSSVKKMDKHKESMIEKQKALLKLDKNPAYRKQQDNSTLLLLWKRISNHRSATVFRKPVNTREAPGYTDRILFPIDLSLIRKMIVSNIIVSYADLHQRIGLMCHNCVKYNGRESDYGIITREFESYVDDNIVAAVNVSNDCNKTTQNSK